jgi:hypothetical protein
MKFGFNAANSHAIPPPTEPPITAKSFVIFKYFKANMKT